MAHLNLSDMSATIEHMFEGSPGIEPEPEPWSGPDSGLSAGDDGWPFWLCGSVSERLERVLTLPPGVETLRALEFLGQHTLGPEERILLAVGWERQVNYATASMYAAVSAATTPRPGGLPAELLETELGLAMRKSEPAMQMLRVFAHRVVHVLPVMCRLLERSAVTLGHVRALEDLTSVLTDEQAATIDEQLSRRAESLGLPAFRRLVARAVAAVDPDAAGKRHDRAKKDLSGARLVKLPDGMASLDVTMPAPAAVAAVGTLNALADRVRVDGDPRTHGERQVEALLDALAGMLSGASGGAPTPIADAAGSESGASSRVRPSRRRGAEIVVFVDLLTLLGMREGVGELAGYGPIPAAQVRAMLADEGSTLHRLVHDPVTGTVTDYTVAGYRPDEQLRALLSVRDVTCRFPGCTRNAVWCDVEHCDPHDEGGATSCANCGLMCRRHHRRKTHDGFSYVRLDPATGETLWQTPLGFLYRQGAAFYYRDGRDTGDTVRVPIGNDWKQRYDAENADPPD